MSDYTILLELALILLFTKLFGIICKKIGLPQVVGFLIAGLLIGPCVLGWVNPSETLKIIAELGVILIMFSAGVETDLKELKQNGLAATLVAMAGVLLPLGGGFLIAAAFNGGFEGIDSLKVLQYVFVGVVMTATSVSITVETLKELGKLKTKAGTIILSAAIIDDVIGIILLSIIIGFRNPEVKPVEAVWKTGLFFVLAVAVGIGIHFLFKFLNKKFPHTRRLPIVHFRYKIKSGENIAVFGIVVVIHILCDRSVNFAHFAENLKIIFVSEVQVWPTCRCVSYADKELAPVFFASIGINASFSGFNVNMVWFSLCFVLVAIAAKMLGCFGMAKLLRYDWKDSLVIGVGMIARGEVCLIVLQKGISAGLASPDYLAMGVLLVIVSSFLAPVLLKLIYKKSDPLPPLSADVTPLAPDILPVSVEGREKTQDIVQ